MKPLTILIAEDDVVAALDLSRQLTQLGYEVGAMVTSEEEMVRKALEVQADQKSREQSYLLQLILSAISEGIIVLDDQLHIILQNAAAQEYRSVLEEVYTDDRLAAWFASLPASEFRQELRADDGSERRFQVTTIDRTKQPSGMPCSCRWVLVIHDITEINQVRNSLETSHTHLQKAQHLAQLGSFELDINTGDLIVSEGMTRISGLELRTPLDFETAIEMVHPDDIEYALQMYQDALIDGAEPISGEFRLNHPDGTNRFMRIAAECQHGADNKLTRILGIAQDITETKKTEEGLRQLQIERERILGQLLHTEKMNALGRLVASIAHEINNPIQAIQGCLSLVQEERAGLQRSEKLDRYLGIVEDEIERIANIVRRMRDFYRPSSGAFSAIHVESVLRNVLELVNKQLQHSSVVIVYEQNKLPAIWADPDQLKQVFLNLILNALDAMPNGGNLQIITAEDHILEEDPQQFTGVIPRPAVRIEFSDEGEGIPQHVLPRIFDPFFTTKPTGTGLGLSIIYGIVQSHNGSITVTSQPNRGTTFTILLPIDNQQGESRQGDETSS